MARSELCQHVYRNEDLLTARSEFISIQETDAHLDKRSKQHNESLNSRFDLYSHKTL